MISDLLTLQELAGREGAFKFVLMEESNFVFASIEDSSISHAQMAGHLKEHGKPIAAGSIFITETQWYPQSLRSESLNIECSYATLRDLQALVLKVLNKTAMQRAVFQNAECN